MNKVILDLKLPGHETQVLVIKRKTEGPQELMIQGELELEIPVNEQPSNLED